MSGRLPAYRIIATAALAVSVLLVAGCQQADAMNLYALVDTGELFVSEDQGESWSLLAALPCRDAVALAAGETSEDLYLATASGSVYRSFNSGVDWDWVGAIPASNVCSMVIADDGMILIPTQTGTIWESTDGGTSFLVRGFIAVSDLISITSSESGELMAVSESGTVSASTDQGATWQMRGSMIASDVVEIVRANDDLIAMTSTGSVSKSIDEGVTWLPIGTASQVNIAGAISDDTGRLYAATSEGEVAVSEDGAGWTWVGTTNQLNVTALAVDRPSIDGVHTAQFRTDFRITTVWPNPIQGADRILHLRVSSSRTAKGHLVLYDSAGRRVQGGPKPNLESRADQDIAWHLEDLPSGIYYARLNVDGTSMQYCRRIVVCP